jgi:large subunit ribosomal protein L10e
MKPRNYGPVKGQAYTRREYVKGFPPPKIVKFTMGDTKGTYDVEARLIATERKQIRHISLEATRVATNRVLMDKLVNDYLMNVLPFPHVILRENKMIFGAHADRLQQVCADHLQNRRHSSQNRTWSNSYYSQSQSQRCRSCQRILKRGMAKLPLTCRIVIEKLEPKIEAKDDAGKCRLSDWGKRACQLV